MPDEPKSLWEDDNYWHGCMSTFSPGLTACNVYEPEEKQRISTSVRDRVGAWFIRPLQNFGGEDAFACLTVMMPLIEKTLRFQLKEEDENQELKFSEGSPLCVALGKMLTISKEDAYEFWRSFRNGLLHRATIDAGLPYSLHPEQAPDKVVEIVDGAIHVYVWSLRNKVVDILLKSDKAMWTRDRFPLPEIFENG